MVNFVDPLLGFRIAMSSGSDLLTVDGPFDVGLQAWRVDCRQKLRIIRLCCAYFVVLAAGAGAGSLEMVGPRTSPEVSLSLPRRSRSVITADGSDAVVQSNLRLDDVRPNRCWRRGGRWLR